MSVGNSAFRQGIIFYKNLLTLLSARATMKVELIWLRSARVESGISLLQSQTVCAIISVGCRQKHNKVW